MVSEPVARELVRFGRQLEQERAAQTEGSFSGNPAADELLHADPNAFLLGVLFTQGIPAERAWAGPYLLRERLGHLDLERLANERAAVRAALQAPPMLHRFKNTLPVWISEAALRILDEYAGDASAIWPAGSSVTEVTGRLSAFSGIGRKKAVMATQILVRHFGVDLKGLESGQVAYDVQVRRVFLRSGLADEDSIEAIEAAAARACPQSPGTTRSCSVADRPRELSAAGSSLRRLQARRRVPEVHMDQGRGSRSAPVARRSGVEPPLAPTRGSAWPDRKAPSDRSTSTSGA